MFIENKKPEVNFEKGFYKLTRDVASAEGTKTKQQYTDTERSSQFRHSRRKLRRFSTEPYREIRKETL